MPKNTFLVVISLLIFYANATLAETVVDDKSLADQANGDNWLGYGRTYDEQRYSPLKLLEKSSLFSQQRLKRIWTP